MNREDLKKDAVNLIQKNHRVVLAWGTSVGKSSAAIAMANSFNNNKHFRLLVIVAEIAHKKNWTEEFKKWKLKECDCVMECYQSLHKYIDTSWDFIIYDEAHHLKSEKRLEYIQSITAPNIVLLSATLPYTILQNIEHIYGRFVVSRVTLKESIDSNILGEPKVKILRLKLDNITPCCEITEKWGKGRTKPIELTCTYAQSFTYRKQKKQIPDGVLHIKCTQQQKYDYISNKFEYWKDRYLSYHEEFAKNLWMMAGSERKRFLGECKTKYLCLLLPKLEGTRYICFCTDIFQASLIGRDNAVHSKKPNAQRIIQEFNAGLRDKLFAVGMLQEGMNLKNIEAGVITQLDACERGFVQKFGRAMRAKNPVIYVFYFKDTRDEGFLENVLNGIDAKYIEYEDCN